MNVVVSQKKTVDEKWMKNESEQKICKLTVWNTFWTKISKSSHCDLVYVLSNFLKIGPNWKYNHLNFGNLYCLVVLGKFSHMHGSAFFYTLPAVLKLSSHWKTHTTCLDAAAKLMLYVLIPDALNIHISMSSNLHNVILLGCVLAGSASTDTICLASVCLISPI